MIASSVAANAVGSAQIAAGAVGTTDLANLAVTSDKTAPGSFPGIVIQSSNVAPGSLPTNVIASSVAASAVGVAQMNFTGTPDGTTFARGDGTWAAPSGAADNLGNHTATQNLNLAGNHVVGVSSMNAVRYFDANGYAVAKSTPLPLYFVDISTDVFAQGYAFPIGRAPKDAPLILDAVDHKSIAFGVAGSTINYSLEIRAAGVAEDATGTAIFNGTYSSATVAGIPVTSFANNTAAAGNFIYFVPKSGGISGLTRGMRLLLYGHSTQ